MEVFTDKLVAKIPSTGNGIIKSINYEIDDVCLVGHTLLTIEVESEEGAAVVDYSKKQKDTQKEE